MSVLTQLFSPIIRRRIPQIEAWKRQADASQNRIFKELITQGSFTDWGSKFHYKGIKSYAQFKERVPISTYEELYPYIERHLKGEKAVLWPTPINFFSKSSGTSNGRSKYIPVSKESLDQGHFKAGTDMIALYLHNTPHSKVLGGKTIALGGTLHSNPIQENFGKVGDISAVVVKNLPWWASIMRLPKLETSFLPDFETKLERIITECRNENVTSLSGVPTWTLLLINKILEKTGAQSIYEVWPNLELFLHGGVSFKPYRQQFELLTQGKKFQFMENYNASEGYFGIQDDLGSDNLLLLTDHGIFYEFIPFSDTGRVDGSAAIPLEQVQLNQNYALVISTNAGLWRYLIGDTVRFTSIDPYHIKITGRTKEYINAFGEELMVENAEVAIEKASLETQSIVANFTAAPFYMGQQTAGYHEWLIEFEQEPKDLEHFTQSLDSNLRQVNSDYDAKREKDMALQKPKLKLLPLGTFNSWLKGKGKFGGQHKVPRLSNDRKIIEEIYKLLRWKNP